MWRAKFVDGPIAEEDHAVEIHFAVFPIKRTVYMAHFPGPHRWVRVGDEHLVPEQPWPSQVRYDADEDAVAVADNGDLVVPYRICREDGSASPGSPSSPAPAGPS